MAGKIIADTLEHSTAGSIATNFLRDGTKCWLRFNQDTPAITNSFNVSSVTDHTTGQYDPNFTTAMSSGTSYACLNGGQAETDNRDNTDYTVNEAATSVRCYTMENNGFRDLGNNHFMLTGELA